VARIPGPSYINRKVIMALHDHAAVSEGFYEASCPPRDDNPPGDDNRPGPNYLAVR